MSGSHEGREAMSPAERLSDLARAIRFVMLARGHMTKRQMSTLASDLAEISAELSLEANAAAEAHHQSTRRAA